MDYVTYIIYSIEVLLINRWYYMVSKTILNPFACLSLPFTFILLICLLFNNTLDFIPFRYEGLWPWILGLFFFWIPSFLIFNNKNIIADVTIKIKNISNIKTIFLVILLCLAYISINMRNMSAYDLGSKELGEELTVGGVKGRIYNILMVMFPFMVCYSYNRFFKFGLTIVASYLLFASGSKTWIMYAFLASIICLHRSGKLTLNIKWAVISIILLLGSFIMYYYLNTDFDDNNSFLLFALRHFYFYLTSGLLPLGEVCHLNLQGNQDVFMLPFINIINVWAGEQGIEPHSPLWIETDCIDHTLSNVFTLFGSLIMGGNYVAFAFYAMFFGFISCLIFLKSQHSNNIFISIMNGYNLSILFFAWFNCAYSLMRVWEIFFFAIFFYYLQRSKIPIKKE